MRRGKIGLDAFSFIAQDSRLKNIPLILETPILAMTASRKLEEHPDIWRTEVEVLNTYSISNPNATQSREARAMLLDKIVAHTGKMPQLDDLKNT